MFDKIAQDCLDGVYDDFAPTDQNLDDKQLYQDVFALVKNDDFTEEHHQIVWEMATDQGIEIGIEHSDEPENELVNLYEKFYNFALSFAQVGKLKNNDG